MFGSDNMGQNNWGGGGAVPLSDGLDTRPCKILDPRLVPSTREHGPVTEPCWRGTVVPVAALHSPCYTRNALMGT